MGTFAGVIPAKGTSQMPDAFSSAFNSSFGNMSNIGLAQQQLLQRKQQFDLSQAMAEKELAQQRQIQEMRMSQALAEMQAAEELANLKAAAELEAVKMRNEGQLNVATVNQGERNKRFVAGQDLKEREFAAEQKRNEALDAQNKVKTEAEIKNKEADTVVKTKRADGTLPPTSSATMKNATFESMAEPELLRRSSSRLTSAKNLALKKFPEGVVGNEEEYDAEVTKILADDQEYVALTSEISKRRSGTKPAESASGVFDQAKLESFTDAASVKEWLRTLEAITPEQMAAAKKRYDQLKGSK